MFTRAEEPFLPTMEDTDVTNEHIVRFQNVIHVLLYNACVDIR